MAFPTVVGTPTETVLSNATSHTINFTQTTGNLVVIFLGLSDTAQALSTVGDSFTNLTNATVTFHVLYKVLDGSEGGNVVVTVGSNTKGAAIAYNISGFDSSKAPAISTVATGTSTLPDPGSLSPSGGAADYLWLAAFRQNGEENDDDTWCNQAPGTPVFTGLVQTTSGTGGLPATNGSIASAHYSANAATVDPGTFETDQSLAWRAYTLAIYPAPPGLGYPIIGGGYYPIGG